MAVKGTNTSGTTAVIDHLWSQQPGKYFCLATKSESGKWREHFFSREEIKNTRKFIRDHRDDDIYFCPHGFSRPERKKEYAVRPNMLWADMDEINPNEIDVRPTIAIESSPNRFVGLWMIDQQMTEELNRHLTYAIGADKSGWDLTQVLRVPGTINYKYKEQPRTRALWTNGDGYRVRDLIKRIGEPEEEIETEESDAAAVYKKWERKLSHWLRRELINGKPTRGKRSEMIWKIGNALLEAGLPQADALTLLAASPWNKFKGRRNEFEQLERELDKALNKHMNGHKHSGTKESDEDDEDYNGSIVFQSLDEAEEEFMDWIYYPYLALGELTIMEGDPGLGKSYLAQMIAKAICDGERLPCVDKRHSPVKGRVVYFDMENSIGTVTKKRMSANGLVNMQSFEQCEVPFSIDDEDSMDEIYEHLEKVQPKLVVFDTLNTYIGKSDTFKGSEAYQAFGKFRQLAKDFDCAVLVLRHLTKTNHSSRALYRGQGNIAFSALARVVITVGVDPQDQDTRVMAVTKLNVARVPQALTFTIESIPDTKHHKDRSRFVWGEFTDLTSDDILSSDRDNDTGNRQKQATDFLKEVLANGPVEFNKITRMAEARSIALRTLKRASESLNIKKVANGFGRNKVSTWALPDDDA